MGLSASLGLSKTKSSSKFSENRKGTSFTLGGSTKRQNTQGNTGTKTSQKQSQSQQQTASTTNRNTGTSQSRLQAQQLTELFGPEVLAQLENQFASSGGDTSQIQSFLTERALSADTDLAGIVDPIVENARVQGQRKVDQQTQDFARGAGSSLNTIVTQLGLEGEADLERQLASLSATLGLQVRQQATDELNSANAGAAGTNLQTAELLKGGTQRVSSSQTQAAQDTSVSQEQQLTNALSSILGTTDSQELQSIVQSIADRSFSRRNVNETASGRSSGRSTGFSGSLSASLPSSPGG